MLSRLGLEHGRKYRPLEKELDDPLVLLALLLLLEQELLPVPPQELLLVPLQLVLLRIELELVPLNRYG
jgi:hypothetical protein